MKNFTRKSALSLSAVLPVLFLGFQSPLTYAQEEEQESKPEPKIYKCKQCVKYVGWRGELDFGLSYISDDSYRFGDYRGLEEKGFYAALDGDLHFRNLKGRYFDLYANNLGYDSRQLEMRGGNIGRYELRFAWKEIPKYRGYGTQTPFLGVGSDSLTLPADWVHGRTTGEMTALDSALVTAPLKTQRTTIDLGVTTQFLSNWSFKVDAQRQEKKGSQPFGAGMMFNNATILPAPVDFTTDLFDVSLAWTGRRAQVKLGFMGSYFENGDSSLTWQNPFYSHPDLNYFRAATAPDNEFQQWNLSAAFAITPRIRLTGQAAWGELKQNEAFLPYTINPSFSDLPLPRTSLNGKLDTSTFNLSGKLSARLNSRLTFTARGKVDERDNKTPVDEYVQVTTDVFPSVVRYNRPFSYEREQYSADLRFRAHRSIRLSGGAWQKNIDRTLQAIERSEESAWWGEVKLNSFAMSELRVKYESADRDISDYMQQDDGGPTDHPLMRKFNQADRDRERLIVDFNIAPIESLGINLSFFRSNSDYDNSVIGLQESDDQNFSVNLNYVVGSKLNLYAFWSRDDIDADLINSTAVNATPWNAMTRDRIITGGFGVSSPVGEKSSIGFDYVSSDSTGNIAVQTTLAEDPFDPLKTKLRNARVHFDHEVNDHWGYKLYVEYENYESRDWFTDGLGVDGITSILSMGEQSPDYSAWYVRVQASYRF